MNEINVSTRFPAPVIQSKLTEHINSIRSRFIFYHISVIPIDHLQVEKYSFRRKNARKRLSIYNISAKSTLDFIPKRGITKRNSIT